MTNKRRFTGALSLALVAALTLTSVAFANTDTRFAREGVKREAVTQKISPEERQAKLADIISQYSPDLLDDFQALWDEHEQVHTQLEAIKNEHKATIEAYISELKSQVENGELTPLEARALLKEKRDLNKANLAALRLEIEALRESFGLNDLDKRAHFEAMKVALENGDGDAVVELLGIHLEQLGTHIAFDWAKLALFTN